MGINIIKITGTNGTYVGDRGKEKVRVLLSRMTNVKKALSSCDSAFFWRGSVGIEPT